MALTRKQDVESRTASGLHRAQATTFISSGNPHEPVSLDVDPRDYGWHVDAITPYARLRGSAAHFGYQ
jgi:hypothetical protein